MAKYMQLVMVMFLLVGTNKRGIRDPVKNTWTKKSKCQQQGLGYALRLPMIRFTPLAEL